LTKAIKKELLLKALETGFGRAHEKGGKLAETWLSFGRQLWYS
jgi:hypothetical protein